MECIEPVYVGERKPYFAGELAGDGAVSAKPQGGGERESADLGEWATNFRMANTATSKNTSLTLGLPRELG